MLLTNNLDKNEKKFSSKIFHCIVKYNINIDLIEL